LRQMINREQNINSLEQTHEVQQQHILDQKQYIETQKQENTSKDAIIELIDTERSNLTKIRDNAQKELQELKTKIRDQEQQVRNLIANNNEQNHKHSKIIQTSALHTETLKTELHLANVKLIGLTNALESAKNNLRELEEHNIRERESPSTIDKMQEEIDRLELEIGKKSKENLEHKEEIAKAKLRVDSEINQMKSYKEKRDREEATMRSENMRYNTEIQAFIKTHKEEIKNKDKIINGYIEELKGMQKNIR
jgi:chromosome segregation ATPase